MSSMPQILKMLLVFLLLRPGAVGSVGSVGLALCKPYSSPPRIQLRVCLKQLAKLGCLNNLLQATHHFCTVSCRANKGFDKGFHKGFFISGRGYLQFSFPRVSENTRRFGTQKSNNTHKPQQGASGFSSGPGMPWPSGRSCETLARQRKRASSWWTPEQRDCFGLDKARIFVTLMKPFTRTVTRAEEKRY